VTLRSRAALKRQDRNGVLELRRVPTARARERAWALPVALASGHRRRFELDHELRQSKPSDTDQAAWRHDARGASAFTQHRGVLDKGVDVSGVHVQPHDVAQAHLRAREDCLEVVERQRDLGSHVPGMLGSTVAVDRRLSSTDEDLRRPSTTSPWLNPNFNDHSQGFTALRFTSLLRVLADIERMFRQSPIRRASSGHASREGRVADG
jgi:hypothetical protein